MSIFFWNTPIFNLWEYFVLFLNHFGTSRNWFYLLTKFIWALLCVKFAKPDLYYIFWVLKLNNFLHYRLNLIISYYIHRVNLYTKEKLMNYSSSYLLMYFLIFSFLDHLLFTYYLSFQAYTQVGEDAFSIGWSKPILLGCFYFHQSHHLKIIKIAPITCYLTKSFYILSYSFRFFI